MNVNALSVAELAATVREPTLDQERALRAELGDEGFRRARELAVAEAARAPAAPRGNVVVLHGIMGGELSAVEDGGDLRRIWLDIPWIVVGELARLRLAADGASPGEGARPVRATGILKRYYVDLLLSLNREWRVEAFWYDWRLDLEAAAGDLDALIERTFGDEPVHLVAHSMGGLVARTFIATHPDRWAAMASADGRGGRLVMLGTPNFGSYAIPQVIVGLESIVRRLAAADLPHSLDALRGVLNTFPGTLQMLPSPAKRPDAERLYDAATWGAPSVSQVQLDAARARHARLAGIVEPERMVYVAGDGVPTLSGVDPARVRERDAYTATRAGDGRVPHELGLLDGVRTYYVETDHGGLTKHPAVLGALTELLTTGEGRLPEQPTARRDAEDPAAVREEHDRAQDAEVGEVERLVATRAVGGAGARVAPDDEREVADAVVRGVLAEPQPPAPAPAPPAAPPKLSIRLINAGIEAVHRRREAGTPDAIAVGHYRDVVPQGAERALSIAISGAAAAQDGGVVTTLTLRGTLRGRLGEPFMLPDPRNPRRLIVLAGMGDPGRFGAAELTVLVRELSWALQRMGRRDLATVLIGAGTGNLSGDDAIEAWILGLRRGLSGETAGLRSVTFAELDPRKVLAADRLFRAAVERENAAGRMQVDYELIGDRAALDLRARRRAARAGIDAYRASVERPDDRDAAPTRVLLTSRGDTYRFGAITADAAVPERAIPVDQALVLEANDDLAAEKDLAVQLDRGQFMRELLFPNDLEAELSGHAPLVMLLDGTTARVHWEMVGQPGYEAPANKDADALLDGFLGTSRGFTRQLRTQFAPPPEPPPPPRRILRVLVVADPAKEHRLPGAMVEGHEVADLLEAFAAAHPEAQSAVEVHRLFGPLEATRSNVLRELTQRTYDVLHYAGHCTYVEGHPEQSGWIFSGDTLIATNELSRVDRVPKFVFSNACESGITVDDARAASNGLAPSFAMEFFARGVANLVCTAWPVNDTAALEFALTLYRRLLGLPDAPGGPSRRPAAMHEAMREARVAIAPADYGARTWGAYQHYGNPHFRFFDDLDTTEG